MNTTVDIVIGANYGDEGKGLTTNWLASSAASCNKKVAVVRANGGAQAGHTVVTPRGTSHTFRHVGAGFPSKAATILGPDFIFNPVELNREISELELKFPQAHDTHITVLAHSKCKVSTPFDAYYNQCLEHSRTNKHGSTGLGIFETIARSRECAITVDDLLIWNNTAVERGIKYSLEKIRSLGDRYVLPDQTVKLVIDQFKSDCLRARDRIIPYSNFETIVSQFDHLVFEGAQGLLLSPEYGTMPHCTPSDTTPATPLHLLSNTHPSSTRVTFVTRCYLTRHGAGPLTNECSPHSIGILSTDRESNQWNPHQGEFRYAPLDVQSLHARVTKAIDDCSAKYPNVEYNLLVTCCDQLEKSKLQQVLEEIASTFTIPVNTSFNAAGTAIKPLQAALLCV